MQVAFICKLLNCRYKAKNIYRCVLYVYVNIFFHGIFTYSKLNLNKDSLLDAICNIARCSENARI